MTFDTQPPAAPHDPPLAPPDGWGAAGSSGYGGTQDPTGGSGGGPSGGVPPSPGQLGIREKRSWKTWQLIVFGVVMLLVGLYVESLTSNTTAKPIVAGYTPPPPAGSGASSTATTLAPTGSESSTTVATPAGSSSTSTTVASSTPTTSAPAATTGVATVLVPRFQSQGNWTSPSFTISGGTWNIGWAYQCTPTPAAGPAFQVTVAPTSTVEVTGTAASGSGVTPETSAGAQTITVQAPAGCTWVVKVTGVGT